MGSARRALANQSKHHGDRRGSLQHQQPAQHLQSRYVGTGHADTNRFEWAVNIHRDSYASYYGHHTMLQYFAIAENESIGRVKYNMMQKMLLPCGLPPEKEEE